MPKPVAVKTGIRQHMHAIFIDAGAMQSIDPSNLELETILTGDFDYIHFFAESSSLSRTIPNVEGSFKKDRDALDILDETGTEKYRS